MKLIAKISLLAVLVISTAVNAYELLTNSWASNNIEFYTGFNTNEDGTSAADYQSALNNAMTSWGNNSNFQYSPISAYKDPCLITESNIYNSTRFKDDMCGEAFGATTLAVAVYYYDDSNNTYVTAIGFNSLHDWGIHDNNSSSPYDFKRVALHEVGHTLGLDHSGTTASIMYPSYQNNITTLQTDDINGIRAIYGLTDDHGNSHSNATAISFNTNISGNIEISGDDDYFRITVPAGGGYLDIYSTGSTDTYGYLLDSSGVIAENDDSGTDGNFRFEGTTVAGTYYILVKGYDSSVTGNYTLRADFTAIPNTPSTPSASDGTYTDKVRISWSSVSGANSYIIYRSTSANGTYSQATSSSSPYYDTSATIGTTYYYRLKACSGSSGTGICSDYSNYDTGYRAIAAPNTPTVSDGTYTDKVLILWSSVSGANSYIIYRSTSANGTYLQATSSSSPYYDTSAIIGTTYYYKLRACTGSNGSGACSDYSNYNTGYRAIVAPNTPSASDGTYTDKVLISWSSVSGANSYIIYRSTSANGTYSQAAGLSLLYYDTSATAGTTYYYKLRACTGSSGTGICSSYSNYDTGYRAITAAPSIAFSPATITAVVGADIGNITVINIGGVADLYSIVPAITNDLSFNINTGAISGTPSAIASATTYTVTATNSFGSSAATISIEVKSFSLDIDGNGTINAPNDGLIIFKYLLNSNANNLHTTISSNAMEGRKTTAELKAYLDNAIAILDVDGNGTINAPNDGLIIFKYLLNSNANNLHTTISSNAMEGRKTTPQLKAYLDLYRD